MPLTRAQAEYRGALVKDALAKRHANGLFHMPPAPVVTLNGWRAIGAVHHWPSISRAAPFAAFGPFERDLELRVHLGRFDTEREAWQAIADYVLTHRRSS